MLLDEAAVLRRLFPPQHVIDMHCCEVYAQLMPLFREKMQKNHRIDAARNADDEPLASFE